MVLPAPERRPVYPVRVPTRRNHSVSSIIGMLWGAVGSAVLGLLNIWFAFVIRWSNPIEGLGVLSAAFFGACAAIAAIVLGVVTVRRGWVGMPGPWRHVVATEGVVTMLVGGGLLAGAVLAVV